MLDFAAMKRDALARALRRHLQGEVRFDDTSRRLYSTDASIYQILPAGVVLPKTGDDLTATVQIAAELEVPVVPRGGGTSLSGQSIGPGLVIDCSKYLNAILDVDPVGRTCRVQPGVVLDQLNRALAAHGLMFGPDVATANRANLGGMIGNNSAGSHSVVYGKTVDHVRRLGCILADGTRASFGPITDAEWARKTEGRNLEAAIYRGVGDVLTAEADEIRKRFPNIVRRVSGYNLVDLLPGDRPRGLHQLVTGSEGTLAVIAEAELNLVPRPKARGLVVPHFTSLAAALDALAACLEAGPSAVELIDSLLIELAAKNLALRDIMRFVVGTPAALLMVEFSGSDAAEVSSRVHDLQRKLSSFPGVSAVVPAVDAPTHAALWSLRVAGLPLLHGMAGDRKPVTFCEDPAVAPDRLPAFAAKFRQVLANHGTTGAFYGHASVGCLHIRPLMNLHDPADVAKMRRIMEDVTDLVLEFGGSLSGEHGDGLVRSEWNRKMFGPAVYEAFRRVKGAFDPLNLLNPGKVVDAPSMTEGLRFASAVEPETIFDYSKQEGFFRSIELCNGAGVCRKTQGGTMCPSYRATRDENDTTRGRANALRLALESPGGMAERWLPDVMDLCLMCKACKAECPSNVDLAKLKAEWLHTYHQTHPRPLGHWLLANVHRLYPLGAKVSVLSNALTRWRSVRWLMEKLAGIDRRRSLPLLHGDHFRAWFGRHVADANAGKLGRVILMDDCFTTFNDPEIGRAAVRVLERAGYAVELAGLECCGRALISKGFLPAARDLAKSQVAGLANRVADGTPILGLEPSCLLTLADEWPELVPGPAARRVAASAALADDWLAKQVNDGPARLTLSRQTGTCVLHGHCHQKALVGAAGSAAALRLIPGLEVTLLETGCCGMAGSFGYEAKHFDISAQIAGLDLLPALSAAPDAAVAAPGTSCRHQIRDLSGRTARHPLELIEASMDGAV